MDTLIQYPKSWDVNRQGAHRCFFVEVIEVAGFVEM